MQHLSKIYIRHCTGPIQLAHFMKTFEEGFDI